MSTPLVLSGSFSGRVSQLTRVARFSASSRGECFLLTPDKLDGWFMVRDAPSSFKGRPIVSFYNDTIPLAAGRPLHIERVDITCSNGTLVYYADDLRWEECSDDYIPTSDVAPSDVAPSDAAPSDAAPSDATSGGAASSGAARDDEHLRDTLARIHGYGAATSGNIITPSTRSRFDFAAPVATPVADPVAPSDDSDSESSVTTTVKTREELFEILSNLFSGGDASGGGCAGGGGGGGGGGSRHHHHRRRRNRSKEAPRSNC